MPDTIQIDPSTVDALLFELAEIGRVEDTGVSRTVYSEEWSAAMDVCEAWGAQAGLAMRRDAVGNLWARLEGSEDGPAIVSGSHIDSQCPGGRYDGALGAVAALTSLAALKAQIGTPKRPLEAVVFCEEEGSRFPTAAFWGSRAIVGKIDTDDMSQTLSFDGAQIGDVMRSVGLDPAAVSTAQRNDIAAFIELHIEQGPILEAADVPVGLVSAITGMGQFEVTIEGEQNHAGAFPMDLRRDPMAGFAEIASSLIDHAHRVGRPAVTTIGQCSVYPAGTAIIPERVTFSLDARHPDPGQRQTLYETQDRMMREICARRGLSYARRKLLDLAPCQSDPAVMQALQRAVKVQGIEAMTMVSGAGHDAQQMALIAPVAMIFVRSKDGRSHTPQEFSTSQDCCDGIRVLAQALHDLAYT